jgi:hypothetical protein
VKEEIKIFLFVVGCLFLGFCTNVFITSSWFISTLESNRLSIYFIQDLMRVLEACFLVYFIVVFYIIKKRDQKRTQTTFRVVLSIILTFNSVMLWNYPSVPRVIIGYFYRMPLGESITYPKYPKNEIKKVNVRVNP